MSRDRRYILDSRVSIIDSRCFDKCSRLSRLQHSLEDMAAGIDIERGSLLRCHTLIHFGLDRHSPHTFALGKYMHAMCWAEACRGVDEPERPSAEDLHAPLPEIGSEITCLIYNEHASSLPFRDLSRRHQHGNPTELPPSPGPQMMGFPRPFPPGLSANVQPLCWR